MDSKRELKRGDLILVGTSVHLILSHHKDDNVYWAVEFSNIQYGNGGWQVEPRYRVFNTYTFPIDLEQLPEEVQQKIKVYKENYWDKDIH